MAGMKEHRWSVVITVAVNELPSEVETAFGSVNISLRDNASSVSSVLCFDCGATAAHSVSLSCPAQPRKGYPGQAGESCS